MRRLPKVLVTLLAIAIIFVAIILGGLRYFLPKINDYKADIEASIETATGYPVKMGDIQGQWFAFGPSIEINDISLQSTDIDASAEKITLSLDIWRTLFRFSLSFRDLTFYQLNVDYKAPLFTDSDFEQPDSFSELFLEKFDHFDLRDSKFTFLTPSGQPSTLLISNLTWLNETNRHRAQGEVNLSAINNPQGWLQVKLDLRDINGLLDEGTIYLQADKIDMRPWFSQWLKDNTGLENANFSLASWLSIKKGRIDQGVVKLNSGEAYWNVDKQAHSLEVQDLVLRMRRQGEGWLFNIPDLFNLKTDGQQWPEGKVTVLYMPEANKYSGQDHLRIRASNIELERLSSILPTFSFVTNDEIREWQQRDPTGLIRDFSLDITPKNSQDVHFDVEWENVGWKQWQQLPSMNGFSGIARGNLQQGIFRFKLADSQIEYPIEFKAPLEISNASGDIFWRDDNSLKRLWSKNLTLEALSVKASGEFDYQQQDDEPPVLSILSGISTDNGGDAWRYLPRDLMGSDLADYLTKAIIAGHVENATLLFHGTPAEFPFSQNQGQFQVFVPLRDATFSFDPDWPTLLGFDIDLNFQNEGLWMKAPQLMLGDVTATNVTADIPDFKKEKLLINASLLGSGKSIGHYFKTTPLQDPIGLALEQLQIGGNVTGQLNLDIPLNGDDVRAKGTVTFDKNSLKIVPIESTLSELSGSLSFDNDKLHSDNLHANWFAQPLNLKFTTQDSVKEFLVDINLDSNWDVKKIEQLSIKLRDTLKGNIPWQSNVAISIPHQGNATYKVKLDAELSHLRSQLKELSNDTLKSLGTLVVNVSGDERNLNAQGTIAKLYAFNSQWLLASSPQMTQGSIVGGQKIPALDKKNKQSGFVIRLPAIEDDSWLNWLSVFSSSGVSSGDNILPGRIQILTPKINLGGQYWHNVTLSLQQQQGEYRVDILGNELKGQVTIPPNGAWKADIGYLYYNPISEEKSILAKNKTAYYSFSGWPALDMHCKECWITGLNVGEIKASISPDKNANAIILNHATIQNSASKLVATGRWSSSPKQQNSQFKGTFSGPHFDAMAAYFGTLVPIVDAPFEIKFDLSWRETPWEFDLATLNGTLNPHLGKGGIERMGGGGAGKLLRLVSFDAILRKLQLDFSDTFSNDFLFDSISGNAVLKNGMLETSDARIDGLIADINLKGKINLVRREMDMNVIVTPEISTTVGVATAFVINPIAGAAVFAATKVLGPLWSKISVIRYHISGSLEEPKIDEVLRQLKEDQQE